MAVARRLNAFIFLGYRALFVHPWKLLFNRGPRGKTAFLRNYGPEGLVPLSPAERDRLTAYMRCIRCGLCDLVCPLVGKLERRNFGGPSQIALAYTRATPDLPAIAGTLRHLPADCGACTLCVDICPTRVPLKELFTYANRKLGEVEAAHASAQRLPVIASTAAAALPPAAQPPKS